MCEGLFRLNDYDWQIIAEELNRPLTDEERKLRSHPKATETRERPELLPPLLSLLVHVYLDAKRRGEEETADTVIRGLDFLGCLQRNV